MIRLFSTAVILSWATFATPPSFAQQQNALPVGPTQVLGMPQLVESVRQINLQLQRLSNVSWEYRFLQRNRLQDSEKLLFQLGQEGWELVGVTVEEGFILKRRRR